MADKTPTTTPTPTAPPATPPGKPPDTTPPGNSNPPGKPDSGYSDDVATLGLIAGILLSGAPGAWLSSTADVRQSNVHAAVGTARLIMEEAEQAATPMQGKK